MKYAYFPGCKIPWHLPQYGQATRAVCELFGIELVDLEFNCCGYPARHISFEASIFAAARNFALAARKRLPLLTPCKCCFGNLSHAMYWLRENADLRATVRGKLRKEGLPWPDQMQVVHLLTALDDAGRIKSAVTRPLEGVRVAAHYGCHALRPGYVTRFDNPLAPTLFERLIQATGAETVSWPLRLECCGNPLWGKNDDLAGKLAHRKLVDAANSGAQILCTACTYCQLQFDVLREKLPDQKALKPAPPALLFPQLLGLSLGLSPLELGIDKNAHAPAIAIATAERPPVNKIEHMAHAVE